MNSYRLKDGRKVEIRKAKGTDAVSILAYLKIVGKESGNLTFGEEGLPLTPEQEVEIIEKTTTLPTSTMIIGFIGTEVAGLANVGGTLRERLKHGADLGISVQKQFWHLGVGKALMQEIIDFAKSTKILTALHLHVRVDNIHAIELYRKFGFKEFGVFPKQIRIDGVYYDTLMMNLDLENDQK
jgi:ribosomal protein S18 acetylase RimI-like enzyme